MTATFRRSAMSSTDRNWQQPCYLARLYEGATVSRAQRLLDLIQVLRRHRHPVSGAVLAEATGVSLRTLYRDIETLKDEGAHIDGEAGRGYRAGAGVPRAPLVFAAEG